MIGKQIRLSKFFKDGKYPVVVAVDHGQTFGPMEGLVDFTPSVEKARQADAVLLAPQMVRFSGNLFMGKGAPAMILRLNWNSIHCEPWHYKEAYTTKIVSALDALTVGADAMMASLVLKTGNEEHDTANVSVFAGLSEEIGRLGIPLIGEVFPYGNLRSDPEKFHNYIKEVCRIACELGADAVKTFYTGERFHEVTEGSPIPIFGLGAEKLENPTDALVLAEKIIKGGGRGVVFGRNVIQAENPAKFLQALKAVVQEGAKPADVAAEFGLK